MKKLLLFILITMVLVTSCSKVTDEEIIKKIETTIEKFNGYTCKSNIKTYTEGKESIYVVEETYMKTNKFKLEILKPEESKGCIIIYDGDKVFLEHPSIEQSISIKTIKTLNKQFFIGNFFENISLTKSIDSEKINDEEYLILTMDIEDKNKYRNIQKIWLKKKDFVPYKLNILDADENPNVEIIYEDFKFVNNNEDDF